MSKTMFAALLTGFGGPEVLQVRDDVAVPSPAAGQVLVRVMAAAMNNTDIWTREGAYGLAGRPEAKAGWRGSIHFPRIQGGDIVGRITAVGAGVDPRRVGQRVMVDPAIYDGPSEDAHPVGLLGSEADGGFAQYTVAADPRAHDVTDAPLSDQQLACLPVAYGTAMGMLERAGLAAGETVLVTGASGGVGLALVQLAAARRARVVALTSQAKADLVAASGADAVVARESTDLGQAIGAAAPDGLDAVADVVGGSTVEEVLPALVEGGRWVIAGAVGGPVISFDLRRLYLHNRRLIGSSMHSPAHFQRLVDEVRNGRIAPRVAATFPLADIHEAQRTFQQHRHLGKIVLLPAGG